MTASDHFHLQEDQILRAVIDENDLADDTQRHLAGCRSCRERVAIFEKDLQELGWAAERSVPPFSRTVTLPRAEPEPARRSWGWLPVFGAAAMAALLVFFHFMGGETMRQTRWSDTRNTEILLEDEKLMQEISEMVESPLSEEMYEITGDSTIGFDEEFMEFVVPEIQEDYQSEFILQGGSVRC